MTVITRFAPSPTGYLHIGGARTALFNWLFSKHMGGKFLLRIEDTDRARSTTAAVDAIFEGMKWLGLDHDDDVVFQFARMDRHAEIAHQLVYQGKAYYCYCTPEELEDMRKKAEAEGRSSYYDRRWRDKNADGSAYNGIKPVVRIKAPLDGATTVDDAVQGTVTIDNTQLDDMILLRSDGTPTYMLSVVVDDHDMNITHVMRGDDHFINSFRQRMIYDAMNWFVPHFSHIPMILGPDGAKLSKRHGAPAVDAYRDMGYLPEALRNYLLRLGWGHGDADILSTEEAIKLFTIEGIGKSPSRFDFDKLNNLNAHYMREMDKNELFKRTEPFLNKRLNLNINEKNKQCFIALLPQLTERVKNINELIDYASFLFIDPPFSLGEDEAKALDVDTINHLKKISDIIEKIEYFNAKEIEAALKTYGTAHDLKLGKIAMPFRIAITGRTNTPSIFHVAEIMGRDEVVRRLKFITQ